jgi:hypothetical protein
MKPPPVPRQRAYDLYWYFASERQRIFERRIAGERWPWTDDQILRDFKFCNVFRAADRVSQYLIRDVAYDSESYSSEDRLFQIIAFRLFSKIETWQAVRRFLGEQPRLNSLGNNSFTEALEYAKRVNGGLYTGAFILCATNAYNQTFKYRNHVELLRHMFVKDRISERLLKSQSLRQIYEILHKYPLMGDFMSYQIALDLNYSDLVNFSENSFTQPGPGALRGLKKVFEDFGGYTPGELILLMVERQEQEFSRLDLPFRGLWGRPLHAIDCQGLFCETDKYCREAIPELESARKRIKAKFSVSPDPIELFFPPKWGINDKLPKRPVLGDEAGSEKLKEPLFQHRCLNSFEI